MWKNITIAVLVVLSIGLIIYKSHFFIEGLKVEKEYKDSVNVSLSPEQAIQVFSLQKQARHTDSLYFSIPDFIMYDIVQNIGTGRSRNEVTNFYISNKGKYESMMNALSLRNKVEELKIPGNDTIRIK